MEIISKLILPIIAIVISFIALYNSYQSSKKAEHASQSANRVSQGQIELHISSIISQTETRVADLSIQLSPFLKNNLNFDELKQKDILEKAYNQAVESNLNAYEEACAKYLDNKTDKERFKKMYNVPLRRLVETPELKEDYFDALTSSYKCILKVYTEWNNLEA